MNTIRDYYEKMRLSDYLYWFFRNLVAFILVLICYPVIILFRLLNLIKLLFIVDGSSTINFPWEIIKDLWNALFNRDDY